MRVNGHKGLNSGAGYGRSLWPVLALLLVAVLTPMACALWFMVQAMGNERLAVRQRLENAYASRLESARQAIDGYWRQKTASLGVIDAKKPAGESFAQLVRAGAADSVVLFDAEGTPLYPGLDRFVGDQPEPGNSIRDKATYIEFIGNDPAQAATLFEQVAREAKDTNTARSGIAGPGAGVWPRATSARRVWPSC